MQYLRHNVSEEIALASGPLTGPGLNISNFFWGPPLWAPATNGVFSQVSSFIIDGWLMQILHPPPHQPLCNPPASRAFGLHLLRPASAAFR